MERSPITTAAFASDLRGFIRKCDEDGLARTLARHAKYDAAFSKANEEMAALSPAQLAVALHWLEASRDADRRGFWQYGAMAKALERIGAPAVNDLFPHDRLGLLSRFQESTQIAA